MIKPKKLISQISRPGIDTLEREKLLRFEKNERTTLFSDDEFKSMMSTISSFDLVAYSELEPFYNTIIKSLTIKRENILLSAGSDLAIKSIFETFIEEGDEIINYYPNYAMFSVYAKMYGAKENVKSYNDELIIDINDLLSSINEKTRVIVISNPGHNGVTVPEKDILHVLEKTKNTQTIVLVDEAYVDFSTVDMLKYINTYKNLVIVRTMSKAYGIASVRIGYVLGCKEMIDEVYKVKPVHEIDGIAAKIGKYLYEHPEIKNSFVIDVNKGKEVLYKRFEEMGILSLKSDTNFVYFKLNEHFDPNEVYEKLKLKNIYIKNPFKGKPFDNFLRTTVGSPAQMNLLCDELASILAEKNNK